jgi:hypothetical protein
VVAEVGDSIVVLHRGDTVAGHRLVPRAQAVLDEEERLLSADLPP